MIHSDQSWVESKPKPKVFFDKTHTQLQQILSETKTNHINDIVIDITSTLANEKMVIRFPHDFFPQDTRKEVSSPHQRLLIPVNFSFTINNIKNVDIQNMGAEVNAIITLAVYYGWLSDAEQYRPVMDLLRNKMVIELSHDENIMLTQANKFVDVVEKRNQKMLIFTVRKNIDAILAEKVFLTPIQKIHLLFSIKIQSIYEPQILQYLEDVGESISKTAQKKLQSLIIKFNLLSFTKNKELNQKNNAPQVFFGDELNIGEYEIDTKQSISEVSMKSYPQNIITSLELHYLYSILQTDKKAKRKQKDPDEVQLEVLKEKKNKLKTNNYVHVSITLFRHPTVTFLTVIFPLIFISFVNLAAFGIPTGRDGQNIKRLLVLVTSIVAYIGLIPVLRANIPPTDKPTLIQILVFAQLIPSLAALIQVVRYRQENAPRYTAQFIVGIAVTILVVLFCITALLIYYCCFFRKFRESYRMVNPGQEEYICDQKLWENKSYRQLITYMQLYQPPQQNSSQIKQKNNNPLSESQGHK